MKTIKFLVFGIVTMISTFAFAQAPERMSYQAVVRNSANALVGSTAVGMRISILQGSVAGTAVYVETQTPTTNANGLVSIEVGGGAVVSGSMAGIDWANGPYFIKTETDPTGGTSYTITGTTQLLSTPYSLHAKTAQNGAPAGGTANQVLAKVDGTDYNTQWVTPASGGSDNLGNHTATQNLNMGNNNITNVNSIKSKELFYDIPTTIINPVNNVMNSTLLDMTGKTFVKISNPPSNSNWTLHGIAGGVHGKVIYLWNTHTTMQISFNSTSETCETCRIANTVSTSFPTATGQHIVRFIYDATIGTGTPGRWLLLDAIL